LRCVRCVNENRKKRKRLRWQAFSRNKRKRLRFLRFSFTQAIAFEWKPGFTVVLKQLK